MHLSIVKFAVIALGMFLMGCAGTHFVRVADDAIVLGHTTSEQITAHLGAP